MKIRLSYSVPYERKLQWYRTSLSFYEKTIKICLIATMNSTAWRETLFYDVMTFVSAFLFLQHFSNLNHAFTLHQTPVCTMRKRTMVKLNKTPTKDIPVRSSVSKLTSAPWENSILCGKNLLGNRWIGSIRIFGIVPDALKAYVDDVMWWKRGRDDKSNGITVASFVLQFWISAVLRVVMRQRTNPIRK